MLLALMYAVIETPHFIRIKLICNTSKEAHPPVTVKFVRHVQLLHLITRINDEAFRVVLGQKHRHQGVAE